MTVASARASIIIATFNRAALLDECLTELRKQDFRPGDEVIVVDNGSTDGTARVVERHQIGWPTPLRLLLEPRPGKSHAVATAVAASRGDILMFTDDDVNVGDGWLHALRNALADGSVALAGGPVVPRWASTVPTWVRRARMRHPRLGAPIALLDYGDGVVDLGPRTLLGANLAVRRDVFARAGGFPTALGKLRGTLLSGEDHELCRNVVSLGLRATYQPEAVVHHWVPRDRARISYFLRWFFWSGITHGIMATNTPKAEREIAGLPLYLVRRVAVACAGAIAGIVIWNWGMALSYAIDVAFAAGYAAQRWGVVSPAGLLAETAGEPA